MWFVKDGERGRDVREREEFMGLERRSRDKKLERERYWKGQEREYGMESDKV